MIVKCVENAANERRRFQPMAKGISVKIEEKAPIREPHLARHTKAQMHYRKYRKEKITAGILIFGVPPGEPISMPVPCEKTFVT